MNAFIFTQQLKFNKVDFVLICLQYQHIADRVSSVVIFTISDKLTYFKIVLINELIASKILEF